MQGSRAYSMSAELTVVGGFYRESCRFPPSDDFWGSGGRGAAAISELAIPVRFITAADKNAEAMLASIAQVVGFEVPRSPQSLRRSHFVTTMAYPLRSYGHR